ncbi:hypothetical protein JXA80_07020 [bacterium]|nr:hypothetical protein [candidate division CSSED10-310 bacterium]
MKLHGGIKVNGKEYASGSNISWFAVYPFFLIHMLVFGVSGFLMAYTENRPPTAFLFAHGGLAILVYTVFYLAFFGKDEVKWMFINAGLGTLGVYTQIGWIVSLFGKNVDDYPIYVHVIPFLYFVLYTFLLRQAFLDMLLARENEIRKKVVETGYIVITTAVYLISYFRH